MPVKHLAGDTHLNLRHSGKLHIARRYAYASMPGKKDFLC